MSKLKLFSSKLLLIFMVLVGFELGVRTVLFVIWGYGKVDYFPHFMESQYLVQTSLSGLSYSSHPFFGFANNESFRGVEELLRYPKDENQFVLGIAGGHFAHRLFQEINGSTNARSDMAQKLNLDPIMKLVVVNLAHNFYKQPQTFLSLLRYTQRLDYVLILDGIDGFFSHKLTAAVPLYFPHPLVYPYPNQIKSSVSYYLSRFLGHGVLGFRRLLLGSKSLVKSGIGFGIWLCASKLVLPLSLQLKERAFYDPSQEENYNKNQILKEQMELYEFFTLKMHKYLEKKNLPYFHVILSHKSLSLGEIFIDEKSNQIISHSLGSLASQWQNESRNSIGLFDQSVFFQNAKGFEEVDSGDLQTNTKMLRFVLDHISPQRNRVAFK